MRLLIAVGEPKLPLMDCELGSQMMQLCARRPRHNRRHILSARARRMLTDVGGGVVGAALTVVLVVLLFTF